MHACVQTPRDHSTNTVDSTSISLTMSLQQKQKIFLFNVTGFVISSFEFGQNNSDNKLTSTSRSTSITIPHFHSTDIFIQSFRKCDGKISRYLPPWNLVISAKHTRSDFIASFSRARERYSHARSCPSASPLILNFVYVVDLVSETQFITSNISAWWQLRRLLPPRDRLPIVHTGDCDDQPFYDILN